MLNTCKYAKWTIQRQHCFLLNHLDSLCKNLQDTYLYTSARNLCRLTTFISCMRNLCVQSYVCGSDGSVMHVIVEERVHV